MPRGLPGKEGVDQNQIPKAQWGDLSHIINRLDLKWNPSKILLGAIGKHRIGFLDDRHICTAAGSRATKREFMDNKTNIEREKAGLQPLDLYTEKYHFDVGYAKNDPNCKKRVEAYEAGDTTALGNLELTPTSSSEEGTITGESMPVNDEKQ